MIRSKVRYYLHNLEGLKQDIADINGDLEQYRAMSSESFQVRQDADVLPDAPDNDGSQHSKYSSHSNVEQLAVNRLEFIEKLEKELFDKKIILSAICCVLYYLNSYDRQTDKQIIQLRYTEHLPWAVVGRKLNYDRDYVRQRDQKIVDEIISNHNVRLK
jgi:hypothetical protein